jgi:transposase
MARVQLRSISGVEASLLRDKLKDLSLSARIHQRYRIISEVLKGHGVAETADRVGCHLTVAYDWVRRFNKSGFTTFEQVPSPRGRPPILRSGQLRELVEVALSSPAERGLPFSTWSVPKLSEYCRSKGLLPPVTDEWVRRLLRREGLTAQRIRTWKTSHDPEFDRTRRAPTPSASAARRARR